MSRDDLPLFNWSPACQFIAFPLKRRIGRIRRVAEVYDRKTERDREGYWRTTVNNLVTHLERLGYSDEQVTKEIEAFRDAVSAELFIISQRKPLSGQKGPGGAA